MESSKTTDKEGSSAESDSSGSSSATKINRNDLQRKNLTRSTTSRSLMESQSLGKFGIRKMGKGFVFGFYDIVPICRFG